MIVSGDSIFDSVCAAVASGCAVWVALRDGRWRKNGLAAQLSARIDAAQKAADRWHETEPAKALKSELDRQAALLITHGGQLDNVATREDLARVEAAATRAADRSSDAAQGIDRIEGMLMQKALAL